MEHHAPYAFDGTWNKDECGRVLRILEQRGRGMQKVAAVLTESFGADPVQSAGSKMAEDARTQREKGLLKMGAGGILGSTGKPIGLHTNHGS